MLAWNSTKEARPWHNNRPTAREKEREGERAKSTGKARNDENIKRQLKASYRQLSTGGSKRALAAGLMAHTQTIRRQTSIVGVILRRRRLLFQVSGSSHFFKVTAASACIREPDRGYFVSFGPGSCAPARHPRPGSHSIRFRRDFGAAVVAACPLIWKALAGGAGRGLASLLLVPRPPGRGQRRAGFRHRRP